MIKHLISKKVKITKEIEGFLEIVNNKIWIG